MNIVVMCVIAIAIYVFQEIRIAKHEEKIARLNLQIDKLKVEVMYK